MPITALVQAAWSVSTQMRSAGAAAPGSVGAMAETQAEARRTIEIGRLIASSVAASAAPTRRGRSWTEHGLQPVGEVESGPAGGRVAVPELEVARFARGVFLVERRGAELHGRARRAVGRRHHRRQQAI